MQQKKAPAKQGDKEQPKVYSVKKDVIFKIFFADERNSAFLIDFLKFTLDIPHEEYGEVHIVDPHLIREFPTDKLGIIDVKLKTVSGNTIHIEIQRKPSYKMEKRIAFYSSKMVTEQIGSSEQYYNLKKVISIVITEKEFLPGSPDYHHCFTMYDKKRHVELYDLIETHTLELNKLPTIEDGSRLHHWMKFIKAEGEEEMAAVAKIDPMFKAAVVKLFELSADEKTRLIYELREKQRMDEAALEEGAREEIREELNVIIAEQKSALAEKDTTIEELRAQLAALRTPKA